MNAAKTTTVSGNPAVRITAIINQKGGSGKTTTAINLASVYARRGLRTLLIDMDPQSHCAAGLGVPSERIEFSVAEALVANHDDRLRESDLLWEVSRDLQLIPSTVRLAALEAPGGGLHMLEDKDKRLASLLRRFEGRFDRCLIDCPPTIGLLTYNALRASREALIPVETGYLAMKGAQRQWTTIRRLIERIDQPIAVHVLPTIHDPDSRVAQDVLKALQRQFAGQIIPVVIHNHTELREAISFGQPVVEYAPHSKAHEDFERLAEWLENHEPATARPVVELELDPDLDLVRHAEATLAPALGNPATPVDAAASEHTEEVDPIRSRAEEMVRRVRELALRSTGIPATQVSSEAAKPAASTPEPKTESDLDRSESDSESTMDCSPPTAPVLVIDDLADQDDSGEAHRPTMTHLFGARETTRGILFVQPLDVGVSVSIAGDFNGWSPAATPLQPNRRVGVHEAVVELPAGRHRYRLVVDGRWITDPHNGQVETNAHGESINIVERGQETDAPVIETTDDAARSLRNTETSEQDDAETTVSESGVHH